jgi:broad specificity phosphatase PhoE
MVIYFATHATSYDNAANRASGHNDVGLSPLGAEQAHALPERLAGKPIDAVFTSDLRRAYETAWLAFGDSKPIVRDGRLREVDYGDLTREPVAVIDRKRKLHIDEPFPNGESYRQRQQLVAEFLDELVKQQRFEAALIVGHRATFYSLESLLGAKSLEDVIGTPFIWQPFWEYALDRRSLLAWQTER